MILQWQTYKTAPDIDLNRIENYCCAHMRVAINNEGHPFHVKNGKITLRVSDKCFDDNHDPESIVEIEVTFCPFCMSHIQHNVLKGD